MLKSDDMYQASLKGYPKTEIPLTLGARISTELPSRPIMHYPNKPGNHGEEKHINLFLHFFKLLIKKRSQIMKEEGMNKEDGMNMVWKEGKYEEN